jgi:hypothetical protein
MKKMKLLLVLALVSWTPGIFAQVDMESLVTMIKSNLAQSKKNIRIYEWIETTKAYVKGELKTTKQNQCYYSVDGKLTKVETGGTEEAKTPGGIRGRVVENKKDDMIDYISKAADEIAAYLPPEPEKIQQIYAGGKVGIQILEPQKIFKLSFPDYIKQGDVLSITIDKVNQKLKAFNVTTYIDDPSEKVIFDVTLLDLPDGTQFVSTVTFVAEAKNLKLDLVNSGYKKGAGQ